MSISNLMMMLNSWPQAGRQQEVHLFPAHYFSRSRIYYYIINISISEDVFKIPFITQQVKNYQEINLSGHKPENEFIEKGRVVTLNPLRKVCVLWFSTLLPLIHQLTKNSLKINKLFKVPFRGFRSFRLFGVSSILTFKSGIRKTPCLW